jgi:hypothetical protein
MEILGMFKKLCFLHLFLLDFWPKIRISGGRGFQNLRHFFVTGLSQLEFVQGAMPRLEAISLSICVRTMKDNDGLHCTSGIHCLHRLLLLPSKLHDNVREHVSWNYLVWFIAQCCTRWSRWATSKLTWIPVMQKIRYCPLVRSSSCTSCTTFHIWISSFHLP